MNSSILFLIFNRPDTAQRVFEEIRKARPPRLYVAADGPRQSRAGEKELCEQTRAVVNSVDWPCEVKTLFREENLGCGKAVSQAITWFFDNEEEGIILEDDILPHPDFFPYCDELLEKYRNDNTVGIISGHNHFYERLERDSSFAFQNLGPIWGWASWKRTWQKYDFNLTFDEKTFMNVIKVKYPDEKIQNYWKWIYRYQRRNIIDTWDIQLAISLLYNRMISIVPYVNLTCNIGFGEDSTHTLVDHNGESAIKTESIMPIIYPSDKTVDTEAEEKMICKAGWRISTLRFMLMQLKSLINK